MRKSFSIQRATRTALRSSARRSASLLARMIASSHRMTWLARAVAEDLTARGISHRQLPYDHVQNWAEESLARYLHCDPQSIRQVVIVGGHLAFEVDRMAALYPNARFSVFEPSPRYFPLLADRLAGNPRVRCERLAVGDSCGETSFFETNLDGSGSLLLPGAAAARDYGMRQSEVHRVAMVTLDAYFANDNADPPIDLLWCDVQGAENKVLGGACRTLARTRAIFLEVSAWERIYVGGATLRELDDLLAPFGFVLVGLGTDWLNGTGNALWIHPERRGSS